MKRTMLADNKRSRRGRTSNRGQALVEFTLILPILLLLFAGLIELGFALYDYLQVVNAAREGARFGSKEPEYEDEWVVEIARRVALNPRLGTSLRMWSHRPKAGCPCKGHALAPISSDKSCSLSVLRQHWLRPRLDDPLFGILGTCLLSIEPATSSPLRASCQAKDYLC